MWGIQGEETVEQTSLRAKHCHKLPTADTSPALWSSLTLPRKVVGNERPQCHPGIEHLLCHSSSGNKRHPGLASNERPQCHPGNERFMCHSSSGNKRHPGLASNEVLGA